MANTRSYNRAFSGGVMSPEMFGRIDDVKFQTGAAKLRNFIATPQGPAENRPGFAFVRAVKDSTKKTRLIPFTYSTTQTMVIELGEGYIRFHTQGATLLSGGSPYEIANPLAEELDVAIDSIDMVMGDTMLCPWDSGTQGRIHGK